MKKISLLLIFAFLGTLPIFSQVNIDVKGIMDSTMNEVNSSLQETMQDVNQTVSESMNEANEGIKVANEALQNAQKSIKNANQLVETSLQQANNLIQNTMKQIEQLKQLKGLLGEKGKLIGNLTEVMGNLQITLSGLKNLGKGAGKEGIETAIKQIQNAQTLIQTLAKGANKITQERLKDALSNLSKIMKDVSKLKEIKGTIQNKNIIKNKTSNFFNKDFEETMDDMGKDMDMDSDD